MPIVSHQNPGGEALRVTKCVNVFCTAQSLTATVDDLEDAVGGYSSIAIGGDGLPVVSHLRLFSWDLRVSKCGSRTCQ